MVPLRNAEQGPPIVELPSATPAEVARAGMPVARGSGRGNVARSAPRIRPDADSDRDCYRHANDNGVPHADAYYRDAGACRGAERNPDLDAPLQPGCDAGSRG